MIIHTKTKHYDAVAEWEDNKVIVKKGSHINRKLEKANLFKKQVRELLKNEDLYETDGKTLAIDVQFTSLSTAASFVTGRIANGLIVWKTEDGETIKRVLSHEEE